MALATRALVIGDGRDGGRAGPGRGAEDDRAGHRRGRRAQRRDGARPRTASDARACCAPGSTRSGSSGDEPRADRPSCRSDDFTHARALPPGAPRRTSEPARARSSEAVAEPPTAGGDCGARSAGLFEACIAGDPLRAGDGVPRAREGEARPGATASRRRVALVVDGDRRHARVTHTMERDPRRGVPGFEVEVIGTDSSVDRRLPAVVEVDVPFYAGSRSACRACPAIVETLAEGRYDLVHLCSPGPAGDRRRAGRRESSGCRWSAATTPSSAPTRACAPGTRGLRAGDDAALSLFYASCRVVLSPSAAADESLARARNRARPHRALGPRRRHHPLRPGRREQDACPGEINVLYAGRLTGRRAPSCSPTRSCAPASATRGCTCARRRRARGGRCASGSGTHATFLGWLEGEQLAARLRERRHLPVRQPHRHLRPGDPRGAGHRAAGRRRRRGRRRRP